MISVAINYANQQFIANERHKNGMIVYPDASLITYELSLLVYAVKMWKASGATLPPQPHELLYRDRVWDSDCALVRDAIDFKIKEKENK